MREALIRVVRHRMFFPLLCLVLVLLLNVIVQIAQTGSAGPFFHIVVTNGALNGPLVTILNRSSELVIVAVGMMIVVSCSRGVDISVGSVMALTSAITVWTLGFGTLAQHNYHVTAYVVPYAVALLVGMAAGAVCGLWNGFLVAKLKIQPMVATLILYTGGRGIAKVVADGQINKVDVPSFRWAGNFIQDSAGKNIVPIPTPIFIAALVVILTALVLRFTALGTNIQAVGINDRASRLVGLRSSRIIVAAFIFCGVCAAIAGIIATSRIAGIDTQNNGKMMEMDAILAVALGGNSLMGGRFSLSGTVIGAITIQALTTVLYSINVSADQLPMFKAIVVVIIVVLQSSELKPMLARASTWCRRRFSRTPALAAQEAGV
ncbi:MAG: ABC transporter permease [Propionibacteriaceae bacterium]|nr:ABC transporter permease [Propionibacteriaceae bacterium]